MNLGRRVVVLGGAGLSIALARAADRRPRIAWIAAIDVREQPYSQAFVQRLRELGFDDGRNLRLDHRHAGGHPDRLPALAAEMARDPVDLWFAPGDEAVLAAVKQAGGDAPIVIAAADYDATAGGRITGVSLSQPLLPAQRLELLHEALPRARKVAVLGNAGTAEQLAAMRDTATRLGIALHAVDVGRPPIDFDAGFAEVERAQADALVVLGSAQFIPGRRRIPELALRAGLPTLFTQAQWVDAGGLMSYGISFPKMWRRCAEIAAAILGGARPAEMPIEHANRHELALNMRTAKSLGVSFAPALRARADRVVE